MINTLYTNIKLSQFKYANSKDLPKDLIASRPSKVKDECRLMVVNRSTGIIEHHQFKDLLTYLGEDDVVVVNNTKVFPAMLHGEKEKTGARINVIMLRELNEETHLWDVVVDPARKIRIGNKLYFGNDDSLVAEVIDNTTSRGRTIRFLYDGSHDEFVRHIRSIGHMPLPEDILKLRELRREDSTDYQTIYAHTEGAVVAPISGLHFTREMMKRMEVYGIKLAELTLHCGLGNYRAIEVEDLSKHRMDSEEMHIDEQCCNIINTARAANRHICCVGTTTMKAIETAVTMPGQVSPFDGWTNKFIFPPYRFSVADMMIANFYPPQSSQFIMVAAFGGLDLMTMAYQLAIKEKYKFGTYGDAMLIL